MQIGGSDAPGLSMSESPDNIDYEKSFSSISDDSISFKQKAEDILHSIGFRAMIFFQILAYGSYSVLVHLCEKDGVIAFSSTTMNFILEFVKLIFSFGALFYYTSVNINICPNKIQI
ncbi:unnamed protein product, partial [Rotaria sp. Silwood2]